MPLATTRTENLRVMVGVGARYFLNLVARVANQLGYLAAISAASRFFVQEIAHILRFVDLAFLKRRLPNQADGALEIYSKGIIEALTSLEVQIRTYQVDIDAFRAHVATYGYPRNYAAGTMDKGGMREQKVLEYFVSLDLLDIHPTDLIVDVASEWSVFPDVIRRLYGAQVYRQDLTYPSGLGGNYIHGNASCMPVPEGFADKLVLHNAFEHFEGREDTDFIIEAWRVLKPGGILCILPLFVAERYSIVSDPLVNREGILWDNGAQVIERPWFHNRFARFYDVRALRHRVLEPAKNFDTTLYHILNPRDVHPHAYLHFALVMKKPAYHT